VPAVFDANLGDTDNTTNTITTVTLTTIAAAAANTKVIVLISYFEATANLVSGVTVGGAAAAKDKTVSNGSDRFDIWSVDKAAGMASSSSIVATWPVGRAGGGVLMGAVSFTGLTTLVTTNSATGTGANWSSGAATNTGQADALYVGGTGTEDITSHTSTATSGTEIHDRYRAADQQGFATGYKIVAVVASDSITGTLSNSSSTANTGALAIYAAAASATTAATPPPRRGPLSL
jgi:hypothetical protein